MLFFDFSHFCTVNGNFKDKDASRKKQKQKQIFPTGNTVNPYNKNVMHKMQQVKVQFVLAV